MMRKNWGCPVSRRDTRRWARLALAIVSLAGSSPSMVFAQTAPDGRPAAWTAPQPPFRAVGDVYYVGTQGLAAYLITSPQGDILLDGTLAENAPLIERNIESLGFKLKDVRVLVESHAHLDHVGALARIKQDTGAVLLASEGDRWALEHGRHFGDTNYGVWTFPAVKVDRVVRDGETVRVGGIALTAWLTPGHTRGCTSWALPVNEAGRRLRVVFPCSLSVAGNILVGNRAYPAIAADYRRSFARLGAMTADVVLTAHPEFADVLGRHQRQLAGQAGAFVDPGLLGRIVSSARTDFEVELAKQTAEPPRR
jgi:metallo-beta-lactamase class B